MEVLPGGDRQEAKMKVTNMQVVHLLFTKRVSEKLCKWVILIRERKIHDNRKEKGKRRHTEANAERRGSCPRVRESNLDR